MGSRQGKVVGSYEHSNEPSGFIHIGLTSWATVSFYRKESPPSSQLYTNVITSFYGDIQLCHGRTCDTQISINIRFWWAVLKVDL